MLEDVNRIGCSGGRARARERGCCFPQAPLGADRSKKCGRMSDYAGSIPAARPDRPGRSHPELAVPGYRDDPPRPARRMIRAIAAVLSRCPRAP